MSMFYGVIASALFGLAFTAPRPWCFLALVFSTAAVVGLRLLK